MSTPDAEPTTPIAEDATCSARISRIRLGGLPVDLANESEAVALITERASVRTCRPLAVVSVNLDHLHHFGGTSPLAGAFGLREGATSDLEWLYLIDGAPIAAMAKRFTGRDWPRLAGSDLLAPILRSAERKHLAVGFIGGSSATHELLRANLKRDYPQLHLAGTWSPARGELLDPDRSLEIAREIRDASVDILAVCLGKPRQELWIDRFGAETGAAAFLAFGAAVDFLAGRVSRAPEWASSHGLEWAWRLILEPRRLARRYLVQAPKAYARLRRTAASHDLRGAPE